MPGSDAWLHTGIEEPEETLPPAPCTPLDPTLLYLRVLKAADVRVQVEFDAFAGTWQGQSTDQQHQKHSKWESSGEVDNLLDEKSGRLVSIPAAVKGRQSSSLRGRRLSWVQQGP